MSGIGGAAKSSSILDSLDQASLHHVVGFRIAMAYIPLKNAYTKYIGGPLGLSRVEFTILMLLRTNPGVTQKRMAQFLAVSAPTITVLLDRLVEKGWIERERSQTDRRHQNVHLTLKGSELAAEAYEVSLTYERDVLRHLSAGEQAILVELLDKVARHRKL